MTVQQPDHTGLIGTLVQLPPATSMQIADVAGVDEGHVRALLDSMVAAQLVEYQPASATYRLLMPNQP
ncbi:hypothetical protein A5662_16565 [Mycobacteriaceae bacterium 1482268.1]|nr:hypothetical protein A5662_16565 [Mycobacteriaceae bacterium 1482268.1]